jgi:prepilin-type N-terminal cleavage/methylation domain-containing protein
VRHSSALDYNQGFTLIELIVVIVIAGILAAFAAPSFLAWSQKNQVDYAITNIEGAIKESQRQAMAQSQTCNITFDTSSPKVTSTVNTAATPPINNCLITGDRTLEGVTIATSATQFNFNFKGEVASLITVVVTHKRNTNLKRCLVVSTPLGLIRTGKYTGNGTDQNNCNP